MSEEENKNMLQTVYDGDSMSHEDLYLMYSTEIHAYLDYKKCIESSGYNKCWNDLISRDDIVTRRDLAEKLIAAATIMYECETRKARNQLGNSETIGVTKQ